MSYAHQYIRSAETICNLYDGSMPLAAFLKQYFREHRKYGSKDRRQISQVCYSVYRLGNSIPSSPFEERAIAALFLCAGEPGPWQTVFPEHWLARWKAAPEARLAFIREQYPGFSEAALFPLLAQVGEPYDPDNFARSHLVQPDLFIRIRPGHEQTVKQKIADAGILVTAHIPTSLALPNGSRVEDLLETDRECVIQDLSSQRVAELFKKITTGKKLTVWDCCAASGGKSLLAWDLMGRQLELTVSDVRPSIIHNLRKRFDRAGIHPHNIFVADLTKPAPVQAAFDLVICDAPCSGSGTWGRTPEQLHFFSAEKIEQYASLQAQIVSNVLPAIKPGGYLLYITCSVFTAENETQVKKLEARGLNTVQTLWLKGHPLKADSMFACLLRNPA